MAVTNKLAAQVLQKAFTQSQTQNTPMQGGPSPFQDVLQNVGETIDFNEILGVDNTQILGGNKTQVISAEGIPFDATDQNFGRFDPSGGEKLVDMLADFNQQQVHMDGLINEVLYGAKKFSNQELLAIQAHVFHVAQMTELTVKSVELAVSSFKGVMNTQIQ